MEDKKLNEQELNAVTGGAQAGTFQPLPVIVGNHAKITLADDDESADAEVSNTACMPTF